MLIGQDCQHSSETHGEEKREERKKGRLRSVTCMWEKNDDVLGGMLCGTCGEQFLHLNLLESVLHVPVMLMLHGLYL